MSQTIHTRLIVEMLGKPKEYIDQTLRKYVEKFGKTYEIVKEEFAEPQEQKDGVFSVFAELEIMFKTPQELFNFCLDAMPSSVEIVDPESLNFDAVHLSDFLNDVQGKLHQTDMIVKTLTAKNKHLDRNATNVFNNFLLYLCRQKVQSLESMSAVVGVQPQGLKPFMDQLINQKKVVLNKDGYQAV